MTLVLTQEPSGSSSGVCGGMTHTTFVDDMSMTANVYDAGIERMVTALLTCASVCFSLGNCHSNQPASVGLAFCHMCL